MVQPKPQLRGFEPVRPLLNGRVGKVIRLGHHERVTPLPEELVRAIFASISGEELSALPELGSLYTKIAAYVGINEDSLLVSHGADNGIAELYDAYITSGDKVIRPQPTYHRYVELARIHGAEDCYVPFDRQL